MIETTSKMICEECGGYVSIDLDQKLPHARHYIASGVLYQWVKAGGGYKSDTMFDFCGSFCAHKWLQEREDERDKDRSKGHLESTCGK